jgi:hypothetical protein
MTAERIGPIAITADPACGVGIALANSASIVAVIGLLPRRAGNSNDIWMGIHC